LSLLMDSVHNLSDEMALVFIYLAFILSKGVSRNLLRSANIFNSVGLIVISGVSGNRLNDFSIPLQLWVWSQSWSALRLPRQTGKLLRLLWAPGRNNAAIRLAYIHNLGDVYVSLAPVLAGLLVTVTGHSFFDPLIAGGIALWIIGSTLREVVASHEELIWPEKIVCGHSDHDETIAASRRSLG